MPEAMEFDHKEVPPDMLFKLDEAKREEAASLESSDVTNPFASAPSPEFSPVKEVVTEMMSHWALDSDPMELSQDAKQKNDPKGANSKDLDDKLSIKGGMTADFVPDSAGPATDVGMPETKPIGGNDFGGGGGGGSGGGNDDFFEIDVWQRRRRGGVVGEDDPVEEVDEPVVEESSETETSKQ